MLNQINITSNIQSYPNRNLFFQLIITRPSILILLTLILISIKNKLELPLLKVQFLRKIRRLFSDSKKILFNSVHQVKSSPLNNPSIFYQFQKPQPIKSLKITQIVTLLFFDPKQPFPILTKIKILKI